MSPISFFLYVSEARLSTSTVIEFLCDSCLVVASTPVTLLRCACHLASCGPLVGRVSRSAHPIRERWTLKLQAETRPKRIDIRYLSGYLSVLSGHWRTLPKAPLMEHTDHFHFEGFVRHDLVFPILGTRLTDPIAPCWDQHLRSIPFGQWRTIFSDRITRECISHTRRKRAATSIHPENPPGALAQPAIPTVCLSSRADPVNRCAQ